MPQPVLAAQIDHLQLEGSIGGYEAAAREEVRAFFEPRTSRLPGGPRAFAQAMESMDLCIAQRESIQPGLVRFLSRQ